RWWKATWCTSSRLPHNPTSELDLHLSAPSAYLGVRTRSGSTVARPPSKSTVIIQQLLEERRQYEAWIARLNDSADATPGHVRARVRSDYEARLAAVTEELKAHAESARQAIEEKRYLRGELQKKEARAAEKLTETELRHAVGEYDESQWEQVHKEVLAEVVSVREDLQSVEADIHKLQELDALVSHRPAPSPQAAPSAPTAPPAQPASRPAPPRARPEKVAAED